MCADPIGIVGGVNFYTYVLNNSLNRIDPWGLKDLGQQIGGGVNWWINKGGIRPNTGKPLGYTAPDPYTGEPTTYFGTPPDESDWIVYVNDPVSNITSQIIWTFVYPLFIYPVNKWSGLEPPPIYPPFQAPSRNYTFDIIEFGPPDLPDPLPVPFFDEPIGPVCE